MLDSNPIVFTSNELFKSSEAFLQANLKALEYKEICIAFEKAIQTLEQNQETDPSVLAKAIAMRDKANERYAAFAYSNGIVISNGTN